MRISPAVRTGLAAVWIVAAGLMAGCTTTVNGAAVCSGCGGIEPEFPRPTARPGPPAGAEVLPPNTNGYVYIETRSGATRCQISADTVGCESQFTDSPVIDGEYATGVEVSSSGSNRWVVGNLDTHDEPCRSLANASGCAVLSVQYRLAPEHKFPVPLDDCVAALRWAYEHAGELGADPRRIALGGDSAGGNLAISAAMTAGVALRFLLLAYPCTDLRLGSASVAENSAGPFLTESLMRWFVSHYLDGAADPENPLASPLLASDDSLAELPPSLVLTAQFDVLRDEGEAFGHRLASLGVASTVIRFPGQYHGFFGSPSILDDALAAHLIAASMLRRHLA